MTQDEIICMAREVWGERAVLPFNDLERFAALVAAHERKRIAKRVADTTLYFDIKLSHIGCEENKSISISLAEFSKLVEDDK